MSEQATEPSKAAQHFADCLAAHAPIEPYWDAVIHEFDRHIEPLRAQLAAAKERAEAAEAQCAAMRNALAEAKVTCESDDHDQSQYALKLINAALAPDAGNSLLAKMDAMRKACSDALAHVLELEDAWLRGAIHEIDGKGGERSNRNVDVRNSLQGALADAAKAQDGGEAKGT